MSIAEKLTTIAENIESVHEHARATGMQEGYEIGFTDGKGAGYQEGYDEGKQAEYDKLWDDLQRKGSRQSYNYVFFAWTDKELFKPKYDIRPTGTCTQTFGYTEMTIDLSAHFQAIDRVFDTSKSTGLNSTFDYSKFTKIPVINTTNANSLSATFSNNKNLVEVEKLILKNDGSQTITNIFNNDTALETLVIEGVIGKNGFNVQWSKKLSKASIISIINALSTTTTGLTVTLSEDAVNKAFETTEGANNGSTSDEWIALKATKSNWTTSLA